jgi:hypothetical protein
VGALLGVPTDAAALNSICIRPSPDVAAKRDDGQPREYWRPWTRSALMTTRRETIRALREDARHHIESRRYAQAVDVFARLETLEPEEPEWPRRAAECHAALKKPKEQADALARAGERFERRHSDKKAEALCKLALAADPQNTRAKNLQARLEQPAWPIPSGPLAAREEAPTPRPKQPALPKPQPAVQHSLEVALRTRRLRRGPPVPTKPTRAGLGESSGRR